MSKTTEREREIPTPDLITIIPINLPHLGYNKKTLPCCSRTCTCTCTCICICIRSSICNQLGWNTHQARPDGGHDAPPLKKKSRLVRNSKLFFIPSVGSNPWNSVTILYGRCIAMMTFCIPNMPDTFILIFVLLLFSRKQNDYN